MKIAFMHFRVYETDGVSLEMDKWRLQFDKLGHETMYISGSKPKEKDVYVEALDYRSDYSHIVHRNAFHELIDFSSKEELLNYIEDKSEEIYQELKTIIKDHNIDLLIPNNVTSLGHNLPVGIAVGKLALYEDVDIIYHHHDFIGKEKDIRHLCFMKSKSY